MEKFKYLIEDKWDFVLEVKPSSDDAKLLAFVSCKISKIYILVSNYPKYRNFKDEEILLHCQGFNILTPFTISFLEIVLGIYFKILDWRKCWEWLANTDSV